MSIPLVEISADDVRKILRLEEGHFHDLKAIEVKPAKLTTLISALANADGGEVFIGVDEDKSKGIRTWRGFPSQEEANPHLQVFEELFPLGQDFDYEFLRPLSGQLGVVLHVSIRKTREIVTASDGTPYVRRGAQSLPVRTPEALDRLKRNKGITSFETATLPIPLEAVSNSEVIIEFMLEVVPSAEPLPWLKKQLLVVEEKPTVACTLLFSDEPQAALPKRSSIKVYRYKTTDEQGSRENWHLIPLL
jgi:ATP-dependent DNA helicase RecG